MTTVQAFRARLPGYVDCEGVGAIFTFTKGAEAGSEIRRYFKKAAVGRVVFMENVQAVYGVVADAG